MSYRQRIIKLVEADEMRMRALRAAKSLDLPDWLIAAGFVRNLVWDCIFDRKTALGDIDVIYFCQADITQQRDSSLENRLQELEPNLPWSVKNQARMHARHGDSPYENTLDAMRRWPEKQTSIGVMLHYSGNIVVRHCFDLNLQFNGYIDRNPARSIEIFNDRVASKQWLKTWPMLQVKT